MGKIIAIAGESQVGKDSLAIPLIERGFQHGSFASNLKDMCKAVFNLSEFHVNTQNGKNTKLSVPIPLTRNHMVLIANWIKRTHDFSAFAAKFSEIQREYCDMQLRRNGKPIYFNTPREILQFVGTEICREISPEYHAEVLAFTIQASRGAPWVITDARFPNERDMLKHMFGATTVRLKRPGYTPKHMLNIGAQELDPSTVKAHSSETSLGKDEDYDIVLINEGSLEDLRELSLRLI